MTIATHNCSTCPRRYAILWRGRYRCGICVAETKLAEQRAEEQAKAERLAKEQAKAEKRAASRRRKMFAKAEREPTARKRVYHCQLSDTN